MNSFTLTAVGHLSRNPESVAKGDTTRARFCLVGTDYVGKDDVGAPREVVTTLWFVAFGPLAESLVRNTRKGDQLIIEARVRSNNWVDKQGDKQYDHDFVVEGFRFGAPGKIKREEFDARRTEDAADVNGQFNGIDTDGPVFNDQNDSPLVGPGSPVLASSQPHHSYVSDSSTVQYVPEIPDVADVDLSSQVDDERDAENGSAPAAAPKGVASKAAVKKKTDKSMASRARRS